MADQTLNRFLAYGTDAQRTAFTPSVPSPASGPSQVYVWYTTDTGLWWAYANGAWETIGSLGSTISPASLSSSQNNYNPTGLSTAGVMRLTASAPVNITGLTAPTPANNQTIVLTVLAASSTITLKSLSGSSSAANQFGTAGDVAISAGNTAILSYDSTSSLWRVVGGGGSGSGTVTSVGLSLPAIFNITNSPVSTSGTLTGTFASPLWPPGGRLTLTSGTPVMTANATAQTTVYYDSFVNGYVPLYDGSSVWTYLPIGSDEISMGLDAVTPHVASGSVYDVFGINNSGTLVIAIGPAWSSTTSRGTGAGTTQISRQNGIWVNTNSLTHAWGGASGTTDYGSVAAKTATYLGTIYATANGQTGMNFNPAAASGGTNNILGLWNAYNRVSTIALCRDSNGGSNWTYNSTTWRATNGSNSNRITMIDGLGLSSVVASISGIGSNTGGWDIAVNQDSTSANPPKTISTNVSGFTPAETAAVFLPALGLHFYSGMEASESGTVTFVGSTASAPTRQPQGLTVQTEM